MRNTPLSEVIRLKMRYEDPFDTPEKLNVYNAVGVTSDDDYVILFKEYAGERRPQQLKILSIRLKSESGKTLWGTLLIHQTTQKVHTDDKVHDACSEGMDRLCRMRPDSCISVPGTALPDRNWKRIFIS